MITTIRLVNMSITSQNYLFLFMVYSFRNLQVHNTVLLIIITIVVVLLLSCI